MYVCVYVYMCVCMYVSMYVCIDVCMYVCMYVCVYVYMCVCVDTQKTHTPKIQHLHSLVVMFKEKVKPVADNR